MQWNCSNVLLTTVFLVSMLLLLASSSSDAGGGGRSVVCSAAGERGKCLQSQSSRPGCAAGAEVRASGASKNTAHASLISLVNKRADLLVSPIISGGLHKEHRFVTFVCASAFLLRTVHSFSVTPK